jgi:DNA-binding NtrC family response regulator
METIEERRFQSTGRKTRVLVVDDEEDLTWSIVRGLSRDSERLEVFGANSGTQALDLISARPVDVLVTDVRMPGMSGPELAKRVRSESPAVEVIFMTAHPSADLGEFARRGGVRGTVEKPFEMDDLRRMIRAFRFPRGAAGPET